MIGPALELENSPAQRSTNQPPGRSLAALLDSGEANDCEQLLQWAAPLLGVLARLHESGQVHGAITPEGVFLMEHPGRPSTVVLHASDGAGAAAIVDRRYLCAPESMAGYAPGPATDLWSVGVLLRICLWDDCNANAVSTPPIEPMSLARGQLRDTRTLALIPVVARALEPDPSGRYRTAHEFARALLAAAQHAGLAVPVGPVAGLPQWDMWCSQQLAHSRLAQLTRSHSALSGSEHARRDVAVPAAHAAEATVQVGTRLMERFVLVRVLGAGATGTVFEAFDETTRQSVALKLLHRQHPSALYRLKREFRMLADVAHPNLVAMHELFVDREQRSFFSMDLIVGLPFLEYVRGPGAGQCDHAKLQSCLVQLAHGLQYLHAHGNVHRDLKPSNVLVSAAGELTIVDFGLVRSLHEHKSTNGQSAGFEGTPAYAAPEQHDLQLAGCASDWYAVGVMLYEALVGKRPTLRREGATLFAAGVSAAPGQGLGDESGAPDAGITSLSAASVPDTLARICVRLLAHDPTCRADGTDLLASLGEPQAQPTLEPLTACCGRESELQQLDVAFERAHQHSPALLLISGESGIGKSLLCQTFLERLRAQRRALVLSGRCFVHEALHYNAFDAVLDAVTQHLRQLSPAGLEDLLRPDVASLARLFPVLWHVVPSRPGASGRVEPAQSDVRRPAFAALRYLLSRLAQQRPVVLFVDDLQWSDGDSVELLRELLSSPVPGVWMLATYRNTTELNASPLERLVQELRGAGVAEQLELGPLQPQAVMELAQGLLGPNCGAQAVEVARKAGGHPLLAGELIRHARHVGKLDSRELGVEAALSARLAMLSEPARELLELVCLAGRRVPRSLLFDAVLGARLGNLRELRLVCAVRESVWAGCLHVEPYHARLGELVVSQLPVARKCRWHGLLADQFAARGGLLLESAAYHCAFAGRTKEASVLAERAAQYAASTLAFHSAAELLEFALQHAQDPEQRQRLRLGAAQACGRAGRTFAAAQHYESCAAVADPRDRTELRSRAAMQFLLSGHSGRGRTLLAPLAAQADMPMKITPVTMLRVVVSLWIVVILRAPWLRSPAKRPTAKSTRKRAALRRLWAATPSLLVVDTELSCYFAARSLALAARYGERAIYGQALAFHLNVLTCINGRPSRRVDQAFERALRLTNGAGDVWDRAWVRVMSACSALVVSEHRRALQECFDIACAPELPTPFAASVRAAARGVVMPALYWSGQIARLTEYSEAWGQEAQLGGDGQLEVSCRIFGAQRHLVRDDVARVHAELALARQVALDYPHVAVIDPWWQVSLELYEGRAEAALQTCAAVDNTYAARCQRSDPFRVAWLTILGQCSAATAAKGLARGQALEQLERCARSLRFASSRSAIPVAAHLSGCLALQSGRPARAIDALQRAVTAYDALELRLKAAAVRMSLARLVPRHALTYERDALAVYAAEGISAPLRWAYMMAPGLAIESA